ncbi:hypothetical protein HGO92_16145 [Arthrobacter sp. SF27]|nr:hypothetical protein [Arthrobacter sp. SF27]
MANSHRAGNQQGADDIPPRRPDQPLPLFQVLSTRPWRGTGMASPRINDPPPPSPEDIEVAGLQTFDDLSANHVAPAVAYATTHPAG